MYIEDRLFSESEQEVYYSVVLDEEEMRLYSEFQREFSKKHKKNNEESHKIKIRDIDSDKGLGRSMILGAVIPGAVGGYAGKKEGEKADFENKSAAEIKERSTKKGALVGAGTGAALGALAGLGAGKIYHDSEFGRAIFKSDKIRRNKILAGAAGAGLVGAAALGALGGGLGARKNSDDRLDTRRKLEEIIRDSRRK